MKRLLLFFGVTLIMNISVSAMSVAEWHTMETIQYCGIEYALQQFHNGDQGYTDDKRAVAACFVGDTAYIPCKGADINGYPFVGMGRVTKIGGNTSTLYVPSDMKSVGGYRVFWNMTNVETLVLPDVKLSYPFNDDSLKKYYYIEGILLRGVTGLKRIVFGPVPTVGAEDNKVAAVETIRDALWRVDELYYPQKYKNEWEPILKNIPCKCKYGAFKGDEWRGLECVIPGSGNLKPDPPSVVTNYVFSTVTNHIYHHDVVTDMTAYHTTVTNVYVHYVKENEKPTFILPSSYDTGFVNVVAEVEGGYAVIPATWSINYPGFTEKYGNDFSKALSKPNGKYDRRGNPMYVWQDYVAGTNPMDETDVFDATIAIEGGKVVVSHTPELDDDRAALRKYTVYGKKNLMDSEWQEVEPGDELNFNFYRVTVRMK